MLELGARIDDWVVDHALDDGGVGVTYRCHHAGAPMRTATIKLLDPGAVRTPRALERLRRDVAALAGLDHPNLAQVWGLREARDRLWLEIEPIEGPTLRDVLRDGPLPVTVAVHYARMLAGALSHLHRHGVRHRDVRPETIVVADDGRLVLADYGLAINPDPARLRSPDALVGTVAYAPPEWASPETLDPQGWDIYAAGLVLYEMLTGRRPFVAPDDGPVADRVAGLLLAKRTHPPLDPGPGFEPRLRVLVRAMTHPDKRRRPGAAQDVVALLEHLALDAREAGDTPVGADRAEQPLLLPSSPTLEVRAPVAADRWVTVAWALGIGVFVIAALVGAVAMGMAARVLGGG